MKDVSWNAQIWFQPVLSSRLIVQVTSLITPFLFQMASNGLAYGLGVTWTPKFQGPGYKDIT